MDNSTDKGEKDNESRQKLDLSDLRDFNFASNWSETPATVGRKERDFSPKGGARRERRPDRRPPGAKAARGAGAAASGRESSHGHRQSRRPRPEEREGRRDMVNLRESPFEIQIFPDEPVLATLTRGMRQSLRTYELFEVARLILEKPDRYHVSLRFKNQGDSERPLFQSIPDGVPFTSEEAAVDHVLRTHLDQFFAIEEVEAEPPKGNFQFIARCTLTGDFLSPPNYHRYQPILLQYYQEHFPDMPFERFRSHIETVKDEEAIQKWLESMTKQKRYKPTQQGEGEEQSFETPEEARAFLLQHKKEQIVKKVKAARLPGKRVEDVADPEIKPYLLAYADYQRRFPLDTANTLRGRLRRQHFFIYKKGSRGISFVSAVKRRHRQPGQVFSESIGQLIAFLEQNDQVVASQLPEKFLGLSPKPEGEEAGSRDAAEEEKLKRLNLDLRWLVSEGYVTEYSDGRLSVHSVAEPARNEKPSAAQTVEAPEQSMPAPEASPQPDAEEEATGTAACPGDDAGAPSASDAAEQSAETSGDNAGGLPEDAEQGKETSDDNQEANEEKTLSGARNSPEGDAAAKR